jgi:hypothetical protein
VAVYPPFLITDIIRVIINFSYLKIASTWRLAMLINSLVTVNLDRMGNEMTEKYKLLFAIIHFPLRGDGLWIPIYVIYNGCSWSYSVDLQRRSLGTVTGPQCSACAVVSWFNTKLCIIIGTHSAVKFNICFKGNKCCCTWRIIVIITIRKYCPNKYFNCV